MADDKGEKLRRVLKKEALTRASKTDKNALKKIQARTKKKDQ